MHKINIKLTTLHLNNSIDKNGNAHTSSKSMNALYIFNFFFVFPSAI